jgi:hypothetical protein
MSDETHTAAELITVEWGQIVPAIFETLGIRQGLWSVGVGFNLTALNAGPDRDQILPSALVAIRGVTIRQVTVPGPMVFDAKTGKRVEFSDDIAATTHKLRDLPAARKSKSTTPSKKTKPVR